MGGLNWRQYISAAKIKKFNDVPFITNVLDVQTIPCMATDSFYWQVLGVHLLTPSENNGNLNIYVDTLNVDGTLERQRKIYLTRQNGDNQTPQSFVCDKGSGEPGGNTHLNKDDNVTVWVADRYPSERVTGLNTRFDFNLGSGATWGHQSFYVIFQLTEGKPTIPPPPTDVPAEPIKPDPVQKLADGLYLVIGGKFSKVLTEEVRYGQG